LAQQAGVAQRLESQSEQQHDLAERMVGLAWLVKAPLQTRLNPSRKAITVFVNREPTVAIR
jgi:hypothetical protein